MLEKIKHMLGFKGGCPGCESLIEYAMDGLEPAQQQKVLKHLMDCSPCAEEVRAYMQVNAGLAGLVEEAEAPGHIDAKVLERVRQDSYEERCNKPRRIGIGPWSLFWLRLGPIFGVMSLVMTFVALGAVWHGGAKSALGLSDADALVNDPLAKTVSLESSGAKGPHGKLVLAKGKDCILLNLLGLKPCAAGKRYVLWLQREGAPSYERLASVHIDDSRESSHFTHLASVLDATGATRVLVTLEDTKGAAQPDPKAALLSGAVSL